MSNDLVLAAVVRAWVAGELPADPGAAEGAAHVARQAYLHGTSVSHACERAQDFVGSWLRHPSHCESPATPLFLAS